MCAFFWIPQTGNFAIGAYVKKRPSYTGSVPNLQVYLSLRVLDLFQKHPKLRCSSCNYAGFHLYPLEISSMDFWKIQQIVRWVSHLCFFFRYRRYRCPCFRTKLPCCSLTTPKGMKCPPSPVWVLRWAGHLWPYSYQVYGRKRCSARKELAMEKGKQKAGTTWKRYGKQKISIGSLGNKLYKTIQKQVFFMNDLRRVRHCDSVQIFVKGHTHTHI